MSAKLTASVVVAASLLLGGCTTLEPGRPVAVPGATTDTASPETDATTPSSAGKQRTEDQTATEDVPGGLNTCKRIPADMLGQLIGQAMGMAGEVVCEQQPSKIEDGIVSQTTLYSVGRKTLAIVVMVSVLGGKPAQEYAQEKIQKEALSPLDMAGYGFAGPLPDDPVYADMDSEFLVGGAQNVTGSLVITQIFLPKTITGPTITALSIPVMGSFLPPG